MKLLFAATPPVNVSSFNQLKGRNMEEAIVVSRANHAAPVFIMLIFLLIGLASLIITVITALLYCKIFSKTGFCWALGLLMLVPIANIVMLFILAFTDWPIQKELRQLQQGGHT